MTYWDSSAILKLYVAEPDSDYFVNLADTDGIQIRSSAILSVEALCALSRKELEGEIRHGAARLYDEFARDIAAGWIVLIPFGPDIVEEAETVLMMMRRAKAPQVLGSLDLIHLASALQCEAKTLVTTDARLREMATLAGLQVLP
jgi:predicted nucleic acid-binding protein